MDYIRHIKYSLNGMGDRVSFVAEREKSFWELGFQVLLLSVAVLAEIVGFFDMFEGRSTAPPKWEPCARLRQVLLLLFKEVVVEVRLAVLFVLCDDKLEQVIFVQ